MANNVKKLRERAGASTNQLAEKVGASPLQVQRIEANRCPAPLELAMRLSAALDTPINRVFPGAAKVLAALDEELAARPTRVSREMYAKLRDVGLEGDARQHTLKILLRGHQEPMFFDILPHEVERIFGAVQSETTEPSFIVFDTNILRIAISLKATMFCHFLWDAESGILGESPPPEAILDEDDPRESVQVYFGENAVPVTLGVEAENGDNIDDERNYLNSIFGLLESDVPPHERLHVVDEDGESAFLRAGDVTLITAPLWVLHPDERDWDLKHEDEEGAELSRPL
jgi:DNA-binding XRE family transcriptional regulator